MSVERLLGLVWIYSSMVCLINISSIFCIEVKKSNQCLRYETCWIFLKPYVPNQGFTDRHGNITQFDLLDSLLFFNLTSPYVKGYVMANLSLEFITQAGLCYSNCLICFMSVCAHARFTRLFEFS